MKSKQSKREAYNYNPHIESRVAKLELGMQRITDDLRDLIQVVRDRGDATDKKIQELSVAVTQASGPKKTDWSTIIAGIMLMLAIGGAAFWPLNNQVTELKSQLHEQHILLLEHQKITNHPVGEALVHRLEDQLKTHIEQNRRDFAEHLSNEEKTFEAFAKCTTAKISADTSILQCEIADAKKLCSAISTEIKERLKILEEENIKRNDEDRAELRMWRQKAMGLSSPDSYVPLLNRENIEDSFSIRK